MVCSVVSCAVARVRLADCGWALLVAGTKLLMWRYSSSQLSVSGCLSISMHAPYV